MVKTALLCILLLVGGCAVGSASREHGVRGYAFGQAKIEVCEAAPAPPCACTRIEGGPVSTALVGVLGVAAGAAAAYFGLPF